MSLSTAWEDPHTRRWVLWGSLALVFVVVNLNRLSSAVLATDLMAAFETTGTQLGTLHAVFFYVYAVMQIPTGILADRVGPRRVAAAGGAVMSVGTVWFSVADGYLLALLARGLVGLGASVVFVSVLRFGANWFRADEFATVSGLTFAASGVGGVLATTPLAVAVEAAGWRTAMAWIGVVGFVFAAVAYLLVRDTPTDAGFDPLEDVPEQPEQRVADVRDHLATVLRDRLTWVVSLMLFCSSGLTLTLFGLWGVPYVAQTYDVSTTYASTFTLLGSVGLAVGSPLFGWLSDRLGDRTRLMVAGGIGYAGALAVVAAVGDPPLPVVAVVFFASGALLGAFVLSYSVVKERHPASASGVSTATVNGAAFLGAAVLPTVLGWVLEDQWTGEFVGGARVYTAGGYRAAFAIATVTGLVALACAVWLHVSVDERPGNHASPTAD